MKETSRMDCIGDTESKNGPMALNTRDTMLMIKRAAKENSPIQQEKAMRENLSLISIMGLELSLGQMENHILDSLKIM